MPSFYPQVSNKNYANIFYAMCIRLDEYFASFLNGDQSRVVYSSTDYALVKRSGTQSNWSNANLPFINYRMDGKEFGGQRSWYSFEAHTQGVFVPELRKKLRIIPISISLDATYWTSRDDDYQYVSDMFLLNAAGETKLKYELDFSGTIVENIALIDFELDTSQKFLEMDWLEKNDVRSIGINPKIQTFLPIENSEGFCIPKKVLIDFCVKKEIGDETNTHKELLETTIDHFNKKITIL